MIRRLAVVLLCILPASGCAFITRVSVPFTATPQLSADATNPVVSADGRYVAFSSAADNLLQGDSNGFADIFVRDLVTGTTKLASFGAGTLVQPANGPSAHPAISADGRFVAFESDATNLVANDTNGVTDVFVADMLTRSTDRVSVDSFEGQFSQESLAPSISDDGRYVAFESFEPGQLDTNGTSDIYVRDRLAGSTDEVSMTSAPFITGANGASFDPAISGDGTHVVFTTAATNLVNGDTNGKFDVIERNLATGVNTRVSVSNGGAQLTGNSGLPSVTTDGRNVAFSSDATDAVVGDTNGTRDVFVRDTVANTTQRVSVSSANAQATGTSQAPTISGDGRFVGFESTAPDLVSSDTNGVNDIFVRDRVSNVTLRVSTTAKLDEANGASEAASISRDGRGIVFSSLATNLDPGGNDVDTIADVYFRATRPPTVTNLSPATLTRGTTVPFTITGDGFLTSPPPVVTGPSHVTFTVTGVTNTSITGTVNTASNAATGAQSIFVSNPGTGAGQNAGATGECDCLTVQ